MDNGRQHTTGFVFGSFMIAAVVVAMLPTRERQLYQYDCHDSGGLVTQLVGFPTLDRERTRRAGVENRDPYDLRECWPERGLVAGRVLSPEEEFANTPTYSMVRTMGRTGGLVETLRRRPSSEGGAARSLPPRAAPTTGEEAATLLPEAPAGQTGSLGNGALPQLAALTTAPPRTFPGGLAIAPFGPSPGAGGTGPAPTPPPTGTGPDDPTGETPPTPTPTPTPTASPTPTPTGTPTPEPTGTPTPVPTGTPTPTPTETPAPIPTPTPSPTPTPTQPPPVVQPPIVPPPVIPPVVPVVPEPATWLMLILGFFAIGTALRGRRSRTSSVAGARSVEGAG